MVTPIPGDPGTQEEHRCNMQAEHAYKGNLLTVWYLVMLPRQAQNWAQEILPRSPELLHECAFVLQIVLVSQISVDTALPYLTSLLMVKWAGCNHDSGVLSLWSSTFNCTSESLAQNRFCIAFLASV